MELALVSYEGSQPSGSVRGSFTNPRSSSADDGKASLFSSCVNLANSVLGTGILALPRAFAHAGFAWGLAFSTLSALLNIATSVFISEVCRRTPPPATFTSIAEAARPGYSVLVNLGLILNCVGACCSYMIVATASFQAVLAPAAASWYWTVLALCVVTPLSFLRSMDALRFTSLGAVLIVLFLTALILLYSLGVSDDSLLDPCANVKWNGSAPADAKGPCPPGEVDAVGSPWGILSAFSSLSMAYGAQVAVPPIFNEMEDPSPRRMLIVYVVSFGLAWVLYGVCAMCGYTTFGDAVPSNILDAYPSTSLVSIGRLGLAFVVMFSFPILAMAFRTAGAGMLAAVARCRSSVAQEGHRPPEESGAFVRSLPAVLITSFLIGVAGVVGFTVRDIGIVADLSGALGAITVSFIAPASVFFMVPREPKAPCSRAAAACITVFGVVMLVLGVYTALCDCTEHPWVRLHNH
ncbi:hypothetical protein AB1Y20_012525 [Prymnesium parvum]|uniref:Amino acid transporter transmembrane domain-containing protein n=1 Tax=Prymnesium parvum TaxID=97485 RepID=A0AB34IIY5_PRYPA